MSIFAKLLFNRKSSAKERKFLEGIKVQLADEDNPRERVIIAIKALEHVRNKIRKDSWNNSKSKSTGLNVLYNEVVSAKSLKEQVDALSRKKFIGWGTAWDSELRNYFTGLNISENENAVNLKQEENVKNNDSNDLEKLKTELKNLRNERLNHKEKVDQKLEELEKLKPKMEQEGKEKNQKEMKKVNSLEKKLNEMQDNISKKELDLQNQINEFKNEKNIFKSEQEKLKIQKLKFDQQNKEMTKGPVPIPWDVFLKRTHQDPLERIKQFEEFISEVCRQNRYKKSDGLLSLYSKLKNTRSFYKKYELILAAANDLDDDNKKDVQLIYNKFNDNCDYLKELKSRVEAVISRGSIINEDDADTLSEYLDYIDPMENKATYYKCVQILSEVSEKNIIDLNEMPNLKALSSKNKLLADDLVNKRMHIEGMSPETLAGILLQCTNIQNWCYPKSIYIDTKTSEQKIVNFNSIGEQTKTVGRYILKETSQNGKKYLIISQLKNSPCKYHPKLADELVYKNDLVTIYAVPEKQKNIPAGSAPENSLNKSVIDIIDEDKISNENEYNIILDYFKKHYKNWNETCDTCFELLKTYVNKNNIQNNFLNNLKNFHLFPAVFDIGYILYFIYDNKDLITNANFYGYATFTDQIKHTVINCQPDFFSLMENQKLIFNYKNWNIVESPQLHDYSLPNTNIPRRGKQPTFENFIKKQYEFYLELKQNSDSRTNNNDFYAMQSVQMLYKNNLNKDVEKYFCEIIKKCDKKEIEKTFFWTNTPDKNTGTPSEVVNIYCLIPYLYSIDDRDKIEKYLKILSNFINSENKSDKAYNQITDELAKLSGQNVPNVNNESNEKIDGILRDAKSLLKSVRNMHSKGFYFGNICLSNLRQIKDVIKSKNKAIINHFGSFSTIHYPEGGRLISLDTTKFENILKWQKADIYALGICFLEMLYKVNFIVSYNQNCNDISISKFIDVINSTKLGNNIKGLLPNLCTIYAKSEGQKIEKFLYMVHDMLNGKLDVYQSLHELETVSEEQKNVKNIDISIFNVDSSNQIYKKFINNIVELKKEFKNNFSNSTGEFKTKANNLLETIKKFEKELCIYEIRITNEQQKNKKSDDYEAFSNSIKDSNIREKLEINNILDKKLYKNFHNQLLSMEIALNKSNSNKTDIFKPIKKFMESILDYINVLLISKDQKDEIKTINDKDMGLTKGIALNKKDYSYWKSAKGGKFCLIGKGKPSLNESEIKQGFVGDCNLEATLRSILLGGNFEFENVFPNYKNELTQTTEKDKNEKFLVIKSDTKYITVRLNKVVVSCRMKLEGTEPYNHIYVRPTGKHIDIRMNPTYLLGQTDTIGKTIKGNTKIDTSLWVNFIEKAMTIARVQDNLVSIDKKNSKSIMNVLCKVISAWRQDPSKLNWQTINGDSANGIYYTLLTGQNAGGRIGYHTSNEKTKANLLYSYIQEKLDKQEYLTTGFDPLKIQQKDVPIGASSTGTEKNYYLNGEKTKVISFGHEYSVEKVYNQCGTKMITLKNPWGNKERDNNENLQGYDTLNMTIEDLYLRYSGISKGKPSKFNK